MVYYKSKLKCSSRCVCICANLIINQKSFSPASIDTFHYISMIKLPSSQRQKNLTCCSLCMSTLENAFAVVWTTWYVCCKLLNRLYIGISWDCRVSHANRLRWHFMYICGVAWVQKGREFIFIERCDSWW